MLIFIFVLLPGYSLAQSVVIPPIQPPTCAISFCPALPPDSTALLKQQIIDHITLPLGARITLTTAGPSGISGFMKYSLAVEQNGQDHDVTVYAAADLDVAALGTLLPANPVDPDPLLAAVRQSFAPADTNLHLAGVHPSPFANWDVWTIRPTGTDIARNLLSLHASGQVLVGPFLPISNNAKIVIQHSVNTSRGPHEGTGTAPITIVEYSDLQCPACGDMHALLTLLLAEFPSQIVVLSREFPLTGAHSWALEAAREAQCVFQQDPSKYWSFRAAVFRSQVAVSAAPALQLRHISAALGLSENLLAACTTSKASLDAVEADVLEGSALGVTTTPTMFMNGEEFIGAPGQKQLLDRIRVLIGQRSPASATKLYGATPGLKKNDRGRLTDPAIYSTK